MRVLLGRQENVRPDPDLEPATSSPMCCSCPAEAGGCPEGVPPSSSQASSCAAWSALASPRFCVAAPTAAVAAVERLTMLRTTPVARLRRRSSAAANRVLMAQSHLTAAAGLLIITSTRRFCCRPNAESLPATGSFLPMPDAESRAEAMPCRTRYDLTESARR